MKNLSIEAKETINDLFEKGYTPREIKNAMDDGAFLEKAYISQELSEEIHSFLSEPHIYEAIVSFYGKDDNFMIPHKVLKDFSNKPILRLAFTLCDFVNLLQKVNRQIKRSIAEERDPSIIYGKIKNFCALK